MKKLKKKALIFLFSLALLSVVVASSSVTLRPKFVKQLDETKCGLEDLNKPDHMKLRCPEYIEDVYLRGNFNPNATKWYYCHNVMALYLRDESKLTLCIRKTVHFPIYLDCLPTDILPQKVSCKQAYDYLKAMNAVTSPSTFESSTTMTDTTTTGLTTVATTPEAIKWECPSWDITSIFAGAGILALLLSLLGFAYLFKRKCTCCHLKQQQKAAIKETNDYGRTPLTLNPGGSS